MRNTLFTLIFLALGVAATPAHAEQVKVVVFGDSFTSGYQLQPEESFPSVIERMLQSKGLNATVLNMSIAGDTTGDAVKRLKPLLDLHPDIVIVELGMNDALRGVDIELVNKNLYEILFRLDNQDALLMVVGVKAPRNVERVYAGRFDALFASLARKFKNKNAAYYPDFLKGVEGVAKYTLADGFHPNKEGVSIMAHAFYPHLERLVKWKMQVQAHKRKLQAR